MGYPGHTVDAVRLTEGQVTHQPPIKGQVISQLHEPGAAPTAAAGPGIEGQAISQLSPLPLRLRLPLAPLAPDSGSAAAPLPGLRPLGSPNEIPE